VSYSASFFLTSINTISSSLYVSTSLHLSRLATILRLDHVCGVRMSHVWRRSMFLELSIGMYAGAHCLRISLDIVGVLHKFRVQVSDREDDHI
jgi:hypothetical protein